MRGHQIAIFRVVFQPANQHETRLVVVALVRVTDRGRHQRG